MFETDPVARDVRQSQTYPEDERSCLSKYWKIYFPDRKISLALFLDYKYTLSFTNGNI